MNDTHLNQLAIIHPCINIAAALVVFIAAKLTMNGPFPSSLLADLTRIYCAATLLLMVPSGIILCCFASRILLLRYIFLVLATGGSVMSLFAASFMLHFLVH